MEQIKAWFGGLDERDQKVTVGVAIIVGLALVYLIILSPINESVEKLETEVAAKQKTVDWMEKQVPVIVASKGGRKGTVSNLQLAAVVNNTTSKYDLPVSRRDSKSPNEMQVWFDNVPFDSFLRWVSEIKQKHGVTVVSLNVRSQDRNGVTSINVKLLK
ncbi:MAG: type II secretion system protein M [Kangiellaceae bacterium]|nr:type II secretion system protein M [Kangiellaceae bacterium]